MMDLVLTEAADLNQLTILLSEMMGSVNEILAKLLAPTLLLLITSNLRLLLRTDILSKIFLVISKDFDVTWK